MGAGSPTLYKKENTHFLSLLAIGAVLLTIFFLFVGTSSHHAPYLDGGLEHPPVSRRQSMEVSPMHQSRLNTCCWTFHCSTTLSIRLRAAVHQEQCTVLKTIHVCQARTSFPPAKETIQRQSREMSTKASFVRADVSTEAETSSILGSHGLRDFQQWQGDSGCKQRTDTGCVYLRQKRPCIFKQPQLLHQKGHVHRRWLGLHLHSAERRQSSGKLSYARALSNPLILYLPRPSK